MLRPVTDVRMYALEVLDEHVEKLLFFLSRSFAVTRGWNKIDGFRKVVVTGGDEELPKAVLEMLCCMS